MVVYVIIISVIDCYGSNGVHFCLIFCLFPLKERKSILVLFADLFAPKYSIVIFYIVTRHPHTGPKNTKKKKEDKIDLSLLI